MSAAPGRPQASSHRSAQHEGTAVSIDKLQGRWNIVSWTQDYDDGRVMKPMGDALEGFILYAGDGTMCCFIARANRFSRTPAALADYAGSTRGTISQTLIALEQKGLVRQAFASRVERYEHQMAQRFSLTTPQIAVMATRADMPMINCDNRRRRHGRSGGGSMTLSRIDQPDGPSSS